VSDDERSRLERVHELLVAAGPPPELPPSLAEAPDRSSRSPSWLPRRRLGAALALAGAIALLAFVGGYVAGYDRGGGPGFEATRSVQLVKGTQQAVVSFGKRDANGNTPMTVEVRGLSRLPKRDYYTLFMTKNDKRVVECGTFNVSDQGETTIRFSVAYDLDAFDGLQLARYSHADHKDYALINKEI
jgi:hypothetical protein